MLHRLALAVLVASPLACGGGGGSGEHPGGPRPPGASAPAAEHGGQAGRPGPGHRGGMPHRFERAEDWAPSFDDPGRAAWQKPDEVVALLELAPGMTVVDLGAGTGYFLSRLSRAVGASGSVVATDIEPDMVRYMKERAARERLVNVQAVLAPADDVGVRPGSVDRILIVDVWHHIADRERYAARLARALRPGGAVAIVDYTRETRRGPPPEHRLAPERVIADLRAGGLEAALASESLPDQYVVVGRRR